MAFRRNTAAASVRPDPVKKPTHNYDKTQARRQAKRRAQFTRMREALRAIDDAATLDEAKDIARAGLREYFPE